jgi:ATP-dependent RNA helicase DeaD
MCIQSLGALKHIKINNMTQFKDFNFQDKLLKAIEDKGFETPSEIQAKAIPLILSSDGHVVGKAQTGTGKTAAFGLPMLEMIDASRKQVQALVVVPTRELAIQVTEELNSFARKLGIKVSAVYGGQSYSVQLKHFRNGDQIIVGTPGRLIDHLNNQKLDLSTLDYVVLDEADEMLNMGFVDDVDSILSYAPDKKRVFLFSATMKKKMVALIDKHMPSYDMVEVEAKFITTDLTKQMYLEVNESQKFEALCRFIDLADDFYGFVFCRTKREVDELKEKFNLRGYFADCIHGDILQNKRERVLQRFRSRDINILIATDVAARGIDVQNVSHVINYHIPEDSESYVHRIGRTGRAGNTGIAISLVTPREFGLLRSIIRQTKITLERMQTPGVDEIKDMYSKKIAVELSNTANNLHVFYEQMANELLSDNDPVELVANLLKKAYSDLDDILHNSKRIQKVAKFDVNFVESDSHSGGRGRRRSGGGRSRGYSDRSYGRGDRGGRSRGGNRSERSSGGRSQSRRRRRD